MANPPANSVGFAEARHRGGEWTFAIEAIVVGGDVVEADLIRAADSRMATAEVITGYNSAQFDSLVLRLAAQRERLWGLLPHNEGDIRVVAGADRPMRALILPRPAMSDSAPAIRSAPPPERTVVATTDTEALAELFDGQARDPAWAAGAEAEIGSHMPAGGDVRCAAFMCRVAIPLPDRSMTVSADGQADAASRHWSAGLSYNRFTATIVGDRIAPRLVFYVTRSEDGGPATSGDQQSIGSVAGNNTLRPDPTQSI